MPSLSPWLAVNPVIFPKPAHDRAWAARAILGEELWATNRPRDAAAMVTGLTSLAAVAAIIASVRVGPLPPVSPAPRRWH